MKKISWILAVSCLFLASCRQTQKHPVDFYYWKTNVQIGETEQSYFEKLNSEKLYIRFFDIDKKGSDIFPLAKVSLFDSEALSAEYIPVVFITNRTFTGISDEQIQSLAINVSTLIDEIGVANSISPITEIQIDCDWTQTTKAAYFQFLKTLESVSGKKVTCTLRLHQIKFKDKTGVPPISKGYLMCYATSDPKETSTRNSILDIELLKDYTVDIENYPIDFDVALPIFSWGIVTNHLGKIKLINNVTANDLDTEFFEQTGENTYRITQDFFFRDMYLNKGFTLKIENITPQLLNETKRYLSKKIKKPYHIVYYHLDEVFLKQYTIQELE